VSRPSATFSVLSGDALSLSGGRTCHIERSVCSVHTPGSKARGAGLGAARGRRRAERLTNLRREAHRRRMRVLCIGLATKRSRSSRSSSRLRCMSSSNLLSASRCCFLRAVAQGHVRRHSSACRLLATLTAHEALDPLKATDFPNRGRLTSPRVRDFRPAASRTQDLGGCDALQLYASTTPNTLARRCHT